MRITQIRTKDANQLIIMTRGCMDRIQWIARPSLTAHTKSQTPPLRAKPKETEVPKAISIHENRGFTTREDKTRLNHLKKCRTAQQNRKKTTTPPQKIHLSCFALRSTMRIVSPLTPSVLATLYSLRCVPFKTSRCCPRSESTARPRSRNSSSWVWVFEKKDCSRRAWVSRL